LEVPVILIGVIVSHLQSAVVCSHWVRRNGTSRVPYNKIASPERDKPRSLQKEASPERDKPRSLQKHGFTGTGQAAFPTEIWLRRNGTSRVPYNNIASPERDKPRSQQKHGYAGTGLAASPTKTSLRRNARCTFPTKKTTHAG